MQRRHLVGILKLMFILGGILLLLPMLKSTGLFNASTPAERGITVDVSQLQQGAYKVVEYAGREIWIYRWSKEDTQQQQIENPQQAWSALIPYEPHRGCRVQLQEDMQTVSRFIEPCFKAGFDAKGVRLSGTGIAAQKDLPRLAFRWQNNREILLLLGKRTDK